METCTVNGKDFPSAGLGYAMFIEGAGSLHAADVAFPCLEFHVLPLG